MFGVRAGLPCRWGRWPDSPLVSSLCEAWRVCALTINYKRKGEGLGVKTKVRHADWRRHCGAGPLSNSKAKAVGTRGGSRKTSGETQSHVTLNL